MNKILLAALGLCMSPFAYAQNLEPFKEGFKYGYKDKAGNVVIPAKYDNIKPFDEGFYAVATGGMYSAK
jgi:hypothetical protein